MAGPAAGIGNLDDGAAPSGRGDRPPHVIADGPQQHDDGVGLLFANLSSERRLGGKAGSAARLWIQIIDGMEAGIDEIAAGALERGQESVIRDGRVRLEKSVAHGAVKSGIALIEEAARGGRRFAYEQQPNLG